MVKPMRIVLIADAYPPMRSSAAVQLRDLSQEMVRQGHDLTVMIPSSDLKQPWLLEDMHGVQVLRLKAPHTKDIGHVQRTIDNMDINAEMIRNGHAWVYRHYSRTKSLLLLEAKARENRRGLWALPARDRIPPWDWRRNHLAE